MAEPTQGGASDFPPTLWTVVRRGGAGSDEALESLCIAYRDPIVSFIRRNWSDPQDAEDLAHGFIAELIRRNDLAHLAPDRGRFRSFLCQAVRNYLANHRKHLNAQKRDARLSVSLDVHDEGLPADSSPAATPADDSDFDRDWALTVFRRVHDRLHDRFSRRGEGPVFVALRDYLPGSASPPAREVTAAALGISVDTLNTRVSRLRAAFGELVSDEIRQTLLHPDDLNAELRHFASVLGRQLER